MRRQSLHRWFLVHKWASLICTFFLLLLCLTGLPLIFRDEIDDWLSDAPPYEVVAPGTPTAGLDDLNAESRRLYPNDIITSVLIDDDEPKIVVSLAQSWTAVRADFKSQRKIHFDGRTGKLLKQSKTARDEPPTFTAFMLRLHRDLLMQLPGALFMGSMALCFVVAIVSGVVLYAPFMRKLAFGTVRRDRSIRVKWLDLHNLVGVTTVVWALVVGGTGVLNELQTPIFALWQRTDVANFLKSSAGLSLPRTTHLASLQSAHEAVMSAFPDMVVNSVIYPGAFYGTPYHYLFWTKGKTPLTSRLYSPVLVDAQTGTLVGTVVMPWYLRALQVSRPLHFGDYGGLPLKIIWALLDLLTILVLASGLKLWLARRDRTTADLQGG